MLIDLLVNFSEIVKSRNKLAGNLWNRASNLFTCIATKIHINLLGDTDLKEQICRYGFKDIKTLDLPRIKMLGVIINKRENNILRLIDKAYLKGMCKEQKSHFWSNFFGNIFGSCGGWKEIHDTLQCQIIGCIIWPSSSNRRLQY